MFTSNSHVLDLDYPSFDGDGMIHGVFFRKEADGLISPCYVNKFIQTDVLLASQKYIVDPVITYQR